MKTFTCWAGLALAVLLSSPSSATAQSLTTNQIAKEVATLATYAELRNIAATDPECQSASLPSLSTADYVDQRLAPIIRMALRRDGVSPEKDAETIALAKRIPFQMLNGKTVAEAAYPEIKSFIKKNVRDAEIHFCRIVRPTIDRMLQDRESFVLREGAPK